MYYYPGMCITIQVCVLLSRCAYYYPGMFTTIQVCLLLSRGMFTTIQVCLLLSRYSILLLSGYVNYFLASRYACCHMLTTYLLSGYVYYYLLVGMLMTIQSILQILLRLFLIGNHGIKCLWIVSYWPRGQKPANDKCKMFPYHCPCVHPFYNLQLDIFNNRVVCIIPSGARPRYPYKL